MKKEKPNKRTHAIILTIVVMISIMALLIGCSSADDATTNEEKNSSTNTSVETKPEETQETAQVEESSEPATESEVEAEAEPEPEPVVYEGIDMESTLPGVEWVATFEGIINEPKMVIFNDSTNKKVIVEQGQTVDFAVDDTFGIYVPSNVKKMLAPMQITESDLRNYFLEISVTGRVTQYKNLKLKGKVNVGDTITIASVFDVDGVETTFTATLHIVE